MFKRDRDRLLTNIGFGIFGLICCAALISASWTVATKLTEDRVNAQNSAAYHEQYAIDRIEKNCAGLDVGPALNECIHIEVESSYDHRRSEQDIVHQGDMALWAMVMGSASILALVVTSVGVVFVYHTLKATRDIGKAQTRACVEIEKLKMHLAFGNWSFRSDPKKELFEFGMRPEFINIGNSPATNITFSCSFVFGMGGVHETRQSEPRIGTHFLGPKQVTSSTSFMPIEFDDEGFIGTAPKRPFKVKGAAYVTVKLEFWYTDVFGDTWYRSGSFRKFVHQGDDPAPMLVLELDRDVWSQREQKV